MKDFSYITDDNKEIEFSLDSESASSEKKLKFTYSISNNKNCAITPITNPDPESHRLLDCQLDLNNKMSNIFSYSNKYYYKYISIYLI